MGLYSYSRESIKRDRRQQLQQYEMMRDETRDNRDMRRMPSHPITAHLDFCYAKLLQDANHLFEALTSRKLSPLSTLTRHEATYDTYRH